MTPEQYQQHVLGLLEATFPGERFERTPDPFLIRHGEAELGLQNLYTAYSQKQLEPEERDARIREHFWRILEALSVNNEAYALQWEEARHKLRVQFVRKEHTDRAPLVTYAFTGDLAIAIAMDLGRAYAYVPPQNLERWNVTEESLYQEALRNLEEASTGIEIHATEDPERLLAIQTGDGYDAARLLLPTMRKLAVDHLGEPCYAAIPNRDFLIMWSGSNSEGFQGMVRKQVRQDYESEPYPLTSSVFVVTEAEVKREVNVA